MQPYPKAWRRQNAPPGLAPYPAASARTFASTPICTLRNSVVTRNRLTDLLILLGIATIGVVTWKLQPKSDVSLALSACNPSEQACLVQLPGGGQFEFSVDPRPIPTLQPFTMQIAVSGIQADKVEVDFSGVGMNMGYNRPQLKPVLPGRYEGRASLPVCVTGTMEWRATVLLESGHKVIAAPFQFSAGRPS